MKIEDNFRHKGLRKKLVDNLRSKGICNEDILNAIGAVPRHLFMESGFINFSYADKAFPIGAGQTISQPYTVAFQTQLLGIKKHSKVLEVGTGSGYQTAVLLELGTTVYTIERQRELFLKAQDLLPKLGYKAHFFYGDGYEGLPAYAPFDAILVTAAAPFIPESLAHQLKISGRLVVPVGDNTSQTMMLVERISETEYRTTKHGSFLFVPMVHGKVNGENS